jgi:cell division protein FtsL
VTAATFAPRPYPEPQPQPQPQPRRSAPAAPPRPHLRLVEPGEARARRLTRLLTGGLVAVACAGLFAIVALRVLLAQGQVEIDRLEESIEAAQAVQQDLRLTVAQLEAPAQIVAAARQRLGMVTPVTVTYLTPPPPLSPVPAR